MVLAGWGGHWIRDRDFMGWILRDMGSRIGVGCDRVHVLVNFNGWGGVVLVFLVCDRQAAWVRSGTVLLALVGWESSLDRKPGVFV